MSQKIKRWMYPENPDFCAVKKVELDLLERQLDTRLPEAVGSVAPGYVLPVQLPVRFDSISYEGEVWYDATGRQIEAEEVKHALNTRISPLAAKDTK